MGYHTDMSNLFAQPEGPRRDNGHLGYRTRENQLALDPPCERENPLENRVYQDESGCHTLVRGRSRRAPAECTATRRYVSLMMTSEPQDHSKTYHVRDAVFDFPLSADTSGFDVGGGSRAPKGLSTSSTYSLHPSGGRVCPSRPLASTTQQSPTGTKAAP